ncbi:serine protease [Streptomyces sp. NBC_00377]|uniref:trypsin-like peptidase domain-containing protein n=1 Tax=unclassified Streptomyces TaxID=2593676 RepID=UPI002E221F33|nr:MULTISPECIES: trypsin-like peptidase domain-containing protein [unclassified Streptomyces]
MVARGPRTSPRDFLPGATRPAPADPPDSPASPESPDIPDTFAVVPDAEACLVRVRDLAGRLRGTGFVADHHGTVITSHEAVDGLTRLVLYAAGDRSCAVTADAVTPLPELDLALVRTEGLGVDPLPVTVREGVETGTYVRLAAGCWREARVLAETSVTYTAPDRFHLLDDALELAIGTSGRDALRLGGGAAGGPVLDAGTGAVVAVLGTALRSGHRDVGFAVPLRPRGPVADDIPETGDRTNRPPGLLTGGDERRDETMTPPPAGARRALTAAGAGQALTGAGAGAEAGPGAGAGAGGDAGGAAGRDTGARMAGSGASASTGAWGPGPGAGVARCGAAGAQAPAGGPLAELLARNAATVPAYGADLNLAGVLELTATSVASDGPPGALGGHLGHTGTDFPATRVEPVERVGPAREFDAFLTGPAAVLGLVGAPGSGRTTAIAVLAARRARAAEPAPTLWLRGADLRDGDESLADAARRALNRAARIVTTPGSVRDPGSGSAGAAAVESGAVPGAVPGSSWASGPASGAGRPPGTGAASRSGTAWAAATASPSGSAPGWASASAPGGPSGACGPGDVGPERLARLAGAAGRPLLLLLDGPEEMPPILAHRLAEWTEGTADWLRETGTRLVVACRAEYWERAGAEFPPELLHGVAAAGDTLPPCVRLGDLTADEAREARARYSLPEAVLAAPDDRHPLTLRLLSEIRAALPGPWEQAPVDRDDVLSAYLDLMCLRVAVRLAAGTGLRGTAVRRLAAKVSGQVHEAARRSLGPGQGELDRASFEAVFPWGPAPARLGGGTGWASAVLTEGLLVPAGRGYRFAHEELADWIQGIHLDLDEALRALVHRRRTPDGGRRPPVPHHRVGPVVQAMLLLARHQGPHQLALRLRELIHALDADPDSWWAARLLTETLSRVPDATPYTGVLRLLADLIGAGARTHGRFVDFDPAFWAELALAPDARLDLLRRLVVADGAPRDADGPRYLDAVGRLLTVDAPAVQAHLVHWFGDERPLPATPHATVATAAQALLHTHRHRALDDLTEVLADCAHPRADELLGVLAEEEPSALCRAVDRWSHDERPARRAAAVTYGLRTAPHIHMEADRRLLRHAALALLARPADHTLHGGALALLVRDPETRSRHLPQALERFTAGDPHLPPDALLTALNTHSELVLDAVRSRLCGPGRADTGALLRALADVTTPALAPQVAALVRETVERRPETAGHVADHVDRRLDQGPAARAVLQPLITGMLDGGGPEQVRAALAGVLAAVGTPQSRPLRRELLEHLLTHESDPAVLDAVLHAAAGHSGDELRALVHRTGLLLVRTPDGATRFDRGLVDLARHVPGFAARVVAWLTDAPGEWAAVVGPSARRTIENLAGTRVPA